jgi:hypothetical protein
MAEHTRDPCDDLEVPSPGPVPGGAVPPYTPPPSDTDARFPEVEQSFPGIPILRRSIMLPRNLFYSDSAFMGRRDWPDSRDRNFTLNNPASKKFFDSFRYIVGEIYTRSRFFSRVSRTATVDFKVSVGQTEPIPIVNPEDFENPALPTRNRIHCSFDPIAVLKRFEQLNLDNFQVWLKNVIPEHDGWHYKDDAFVAPAAFFAREADGLNIRLPELVSMQTWFSSQITQEEIQRSRASEAMMISETDKRSLYERFAMEYQDRPDYCAIGASQSVSVHKFPADKIQLINDITQFATDIRNESQYSSFRRVFKREYDYYTRISFDINNQSEIASHLKLRKLDSLLMGVIDTESPSKDQIYTQLLDEKVQDFLGVSSNDRLSLNYRPNSYEEPTDKMLSYLKPAAMVTDYPSMQLALDPATYPLSFEGSEAWLEELDTYLDSEQQFIAHYSAPALIRLGIFKHWLNLHLEGKKRSFKKIMEGEMSYSEVVAYRLEKTDPETGEVIQNFYFFNDPDTDRIDFIDTQVFFGKRYEYNIYTINMVVGSKYQYQRLLDRNGHLIVATDPAGGLEFDFNVIQSMALSLIEAPYFQQELMILDAPPLPPDPFFDTPRETPAGQICRILFTPTFGSEMAEPISILESDREIITAMKQAQNAPTAPGSKIMYRSDTDPTLYEMFVLDRPPTNYKDFILGDKYEASIRSPDIKVIPQPNKDFYLTFRSRDLAGISNPSKVMRYRLNVYEGERPTLEVEEHYFEQQTEDYLMSFNQLLQVEPAPSQRAVNFDDSQDYSSLTSDFRSLLETTRGVSGLRLGVDPENILWNKKFLIEITSAVSGKRLKILTNWSQIVMASGQTEEEASAPSFLRLLSRFGITEEQSRLLLNNPYCLERERQQRYQNNASGVDNRFRRPPITAPGLDSPISKPPEENSIPSFGVILEPPDPRDDDIPTEEELIQRSILEKFDPQDPIGPVFEGGNPPPRPPVRTPTPSRPQSNQPSPGGTPAPPGQPPRGSGGY